MPLFQILLRARAQGKKKKKNGIPFWVVALLLFCRGQEQLGILLDLDPVIIFF